MLDLPVWMVWIVVGGPTRCLEYYLEEAAARRAFEARKLSDV
jgi:hypothetical protein